MKAFMKLVANSVTQKPFQLDGHILKGRREGLLKAFNEALREGLQKAFA